VEQTSLDRFLLVLHRNREEAGRIVVDIRRRIAAFAESNKVADAEGFADKVMDVLLDSVKSSMKRRTTGNEGESG